MLGWKSFTAYAIFFVWFFSIIFCFWWFELRLINSLESLTRDQLFSAERLSYNLKKSDTGVEVHHFFDSRCPCSRFNTEHVYQVMDEFGVQNVSFHIVVPDPNDLDEAMKTFPAATSYQVANKVVPPPASPSVLVLSSGRAQYIGPWSPNAVCNSESEDYVTNVLNDVLQDQVINQTYQLARGCLCPWPV